ncbi:MAG: aconitate hydratase AcnA, partial [Pseudomonadales bacterium]|nr:aconitate hydratase AcnA [Pseudomonadales bacterium]
ADRATIANMAPEYGATCGFFPVDQKTLEYLTLTGRDQACIDLVEHYCKVQGLWHDHQSPHPQYAEHLHLNISDVEASLAGPKRPQDRVALPQLKTTMDQFIELDGKAGVLNQGFPLQRSNEVMHHGDVAIAAITSCTNTSNPAVMLAAGLLAKKAVTAGLSRKPWVKSSLAPGSKVVTDYLVKAGLQQFLDQLGFNLVGYGCTTCIGNSGPLPDNVANCVNENNLVVCSVLSGNRNFEGRIHPLVKANWLASPPLVVAFALAGTTRIDLSSEPLGQSVDGTDIYLKDLWPTTAEIEQAMQLIDKNMFQQQYSQVFAGDESWRTITTATDKTYPFSADSTYLQLPPFFEEKYTNTEKKNLNGARILAILGDSVTTDHISPAGSIPTNSPAADYLRSKGVNESDFNSFGSRRGNHQVMMRGTFGNIRIRNQMVPGVEGGYTRIAETKEPVFIYDAAMHYLEKNIATVVFAGKEYGTGSSRDWAAKGTLLLGVKAVIAQSFERIHRSNLIGMGVLPVQLPAGVTVASLALTGDEAIDIIGLDKQLQPKQHFQLVIHAGNAKKQELEVQSRLDTAMEVNYYLAGGILPFVLNQL